MSDPRNHHPVPMAPTVEPIAEFDRRPTLVEASLASARSISHTMTGVIQPQIDTHSAAIAKADGQIGTQGEAIAGAKAQIDVHTAALAKAEGQIGPQGEALAGAKAQINVHTAAIAKADGQIGAQGEAIAGAKARLDAQNETLTGVQAHVATLGETTARHDQALTSALLGEEGHIRRLDGVVIELVRRVAWLEENCKPDEPPPGRTTPDEAREMREAIDALRERFTPIEGAIDQMRAQGGTSRAPRRG